MTQMSAAARIFVRELRGGFRGFRVFVACLALGVASVAAIGTVKSSVETGLATEGASILGGDAEIEFSYRFADDEELEWMQRVSERMSTVVDFRSMATTTRNGDQVRSLTQVKAIDGNYPLYGEVVLDPPGQALDALAPAGGIPGALMQRSLANRLQIEPGDTFALGTREFRLAAFVEQEPDAIASGPLPGPKTIVLASDLAGSGLLGPGSLFTSQYRLALDESVDLELLGNEARAQFSDRGLQWRDKRDGDPGIRRFVERVGAFLVLVGLAGITVGGVGVAAAVRVFLEQKTETIATLKTLGAQKNTVLAVYLMQVGLMILIGVLVGNALGAAIPLALAPVITQYLPVPVVPAVYVAPLLEAATYGLLAGLVFSLWSLARTREISAASLFRGGIGGGRKLPPPAYLAAVFLLAAALVAAASWYTGAISLTAWTAAGIAGSLLALSLLALGLRQVLKRLARSRLLRGNAILRIATGSIGGPNSDAVPVILSLGLGLTVLAAIGQVSVNLSNSIRNDLPDVAPAFFALDIQNAQLQPFLDLAASHPEVSDIETAPMLRGVITRINGSPAAEVAGDHWVLRGDRGVTYAATPPEGTVVVEGEWWPVDYSGEPLVSFAEEEGRELGLELGDRLTVNILGRDIVANISSFRVVDFSTAGIGFIMSMNPSALAGAPHTHIATVYASEAAETELHRQIGAAMPNVTLISVKEGIARFADILGKLVASITYGSGITLATGFIVLVGTAAAGERLRTYDSAILKTLGAVRSRILAYLALRFVMLGAAAGAFAILAGALVGWAVITYLMEFDFVFEPVSAVAIVVGGSVISLAAGLIFALGPLGVSPSRVLRARD